MGLLLTILGVRTAQAPSRQIVVPPAKPLAIDGDAAVQRLAAAVRIRTISRQGEEVDAEAMGALHRLLEESFPRAHEALVRERVAEHSLLYRWRGTDASLPPIVLMAHMDVVPVAKPEAWTHDPFGGVIDGGFLWGRGTMDDKVSVFGILEAIEALLAEGFEPQRTVLLAFGHDEEVPAQAVGAAAIAAKVAAEGTRPFLVLDEGSIIADGIIPGLAPPAALVGLTEKGYATMRLTAEAVGGHSSMPPERPSTVLLAEAITALRDHPLPPTIDGAVAEQFDWLGPHMPITTRVAMANRWLLGGLIERLMQKSRAGRAQLRTTTAVTMLRAGVKENVLPPAATATVNFRIRPGETIATVKRHVEETVGEGIRVEVVKGSSDPPPLSPSTGPAFEAMQRTISATFPEAIVAPSLVVATTDARAWAQKADAVYRFMPLVLGPEDPERIHGVDERIAVGAYVRAIGFYAELLRQTSSP